MRQLGRCLTPPIDAGTPAKLPHSKSPPSALRLACYHFPKLVRSAAIPPSAVNRPLNLRRYGMKLREKTCFGKLAFCMAAFAALVWPAATSGQTSFSIYFPYYAVGGGYATTFTFINTGNTTATGTLWFWDAGGNSRTPVEIVVSSKGVSSFRMQGSTLRTGWAMYEAEGGNISGVATFEYAESGGILESIAGVPAYPRTQSASIAVDHEPDLQLNTAYAIANPGPEAMLVTLNAIADDGVTMDEP
jgi:hypothetical protein